VYVFTQSGSTWSQTQKIISGVSNDAFGHGVALSGSTLVVGAPQTSGGSMSPPGGAYVYAQSGGTFSLIAQPMPLQASPTQTGDQFGASVGVDSTTNTILIGAPAATVSSNPGAGAAYVFGLSGATWTQTQELTQAGGTGQGLGTAVALSGSNALVGTQGDNVALAFAQSGGTFGLPQVLSAIGSLGFGQAVSILGTAAVVGAPSTPGGGAAYAFQLLSTTWSPLGTLTSVGAGTSGLLGTGVAVAPTVTIHGATAPSFLVGASNAAGGAGATYWFGPQGTIVLPAPALGPRGVWIAAALFLAVGVGLTARGQARGARVQRLGRRGPRPSATS
jgi:hypothetical protein